MELAPRYCRTCGSRILVKHICHNCNKEPLKGENYCYDCGSLTPNSDACLKCGAKYKQSFPVKPIIVGGLLIIAITAVAYFILNADDSQNVVQQKASTQITPTKSAEEVTLTQKTIVNNPVDTAKLVVNKVDTIKQNNTAIIDTTKLKPNSPDTAVVKKTEQGVFTSDELKAYNKKCTYFEKGMKSRILFFVAGGSGYIKINDRTYELKKKRKGVDVAVFSGNEYEATLTIDGLSGNAKEWLASCTLSIKDLVQKTSVKHKVYSSCINL
jgi:hypothetical protein